MPVAVLLKAEGVVHHPDERGIWAGLNALAWAIWLRGASDQADEGSGSCAIRFQHAVLHGARRSVAVRRHIGVDGQVAGGDLDAGDFVLDGVEGELLAPTSWRCRRIKVCCCVCCWMAKAARAMRRRRRPASAAIVIDEAACEDPSAISCVERTEIRFAQWYPTGDGAAPGLGAGAGRARASGRGGRVSRQETQPTWRCEARPARRRTTLHRMYRTMLLSRALDIRMFALNRQGRVPSWCPARARRRAGGDGRGAAAGARLLSALLPRSGGGAGDRRHAARRHDGPVRPRRRPGQRRPPDAGALFRPAAAHLHRVQLRGNPDPARAGLALAIKLRGEDEWPSPASAKGRPARATSMRRQLRRRPPLPVIFFCQNNHYAITEPQSGRWR